jgi:hypothetical protein
VVRKRGRPALDDLDRLVSEGRYLLARHELTVLLDRVPTIEEIADYMTNTMKVAGSPRTVETIRANMRTWQRETAAALGWDPSPSLHPPDGLASKRAAILGAYALGELRTSEASRELALAGLPADARELRKWKARLQQVE